MNGTVLEDRIAGLESKLDFIVEELTQLRKIRLGALELVADPAIASQGEMIDAVDAVDSTNLRPQELASLVKTVLQDASLLTGAMQQLESAADFIQDAQPIVRDIFGKAVAGCQVLQQKGYFDAASAGLRVGDAMVSSHSAEDWRQIEASVPQLIGFLRELTRPEALRALEAIIHGFGTVQATMNADKSAFQLVRDLNSPDARRGIAIMVEFLKVVGTRGTVTGQAGA